MSVHLKWERGRGHKETQLHTETLKKWAEKEIRFHSWKSGVITTNKDQLDGKEKWSFFLQSQTWFWALFEYLLHPVPLSCLIPLSKHKLSADGFIHLTWQPTSENCFGVMTGRSWREKIWVERERRKKKVSAWVYPWIMELLWCSIKPRRNISMMRSCNTGWLSDKVLSHQGNFQKCYIVFKTVSH